MNKLASASQEEILRHDEKRRCIATGYDMGILRQFHNLILADMKRLSTKRITQFFVGVLYTWLIVSPVAGATLVVPNIATGFGTPIGDSFVISNRSEEELNPVVAYNSRQKEYLVVWWNDRQGNDDIRTERVSSDGKLLGGAWVATGAGAERRYPDVAYNSAQNEYLVVWNDEWDIYGQRLSVPSGPGDPQLQGDPITIALGTWDTDHCRKPKVAYATTPDSYLVVFMCGGETYKVQGRILLSNGAPSGSVFDISPTMWSQEYPDLAYNRQQNNYLVVWQQKVGNYDIYARLVGPDGSLVGSDSFIICGLPFCEETKPSVAAISTATSLGTYMVLWQSDDSFEGEIYAQLVTGDGNLDGPNHGISGDYPTGFQAVPAVAGSESNQQFLVVVKSGASSPFEAQAISSDFTQWSVWYVLDSGTEADHPAIASGPTGDFLVAFDRHPFSSQDIYGQIWGSIRVYLPLAVRH